jgi:hypothetical protein
MRSHRPSEIPEHAKATLEVDVDYSVELLIGNLYETLANVDTGRYDDDIRGSELGEHVCRGISAGYIEMKCSGSWQLVRQSSNRLAVDVRTPHLGAESG